MSANEIRAELEKVEAWIFYTECADFMDWKAYHELKAEKAKLEKMLKEVEG